MGHRCDRRKFEKLCAELSIPLGPEICSGCLGYFGREYAYLDCPKCSRGSYCSEACIKQYHERDCWTYSPGMEICAHWCGDDVATVGNGLEAESDSEEKFRRTLAHFEANVQTTIARTVGASNKIDKMLQMLSDRSLDFAFGGKTLDARKTPTFDADFVSRLESECGVGSAYRACEACPKFASAIDAAAADVAHVIDVGTPYSRFEISSMQLGSKNFAAAVKTLILSRTVENVAVSGKYVKWALLPDDVFDSAESSSDADDDASAEATLRYVWEIMERLPSVRVVRIVGVAFDADKKYVVDATVEGGSVFGGAPLLPATAAPVDKQKVSKKLREFDRVEFLNCRFRGEPRYSPSSGGGDAQSTVAAALFRPREVAVAGLTAVVDSGFAGILSGVAKFPTVATSRRTDVSVEGTIGYVGFANLLCVARTNPAAYSLKRIFGTIVPLISDRAGFACADDGRRNPTLVETLGLFDTRAVNMSSIVPLVSCADLEVDDRTLRPDFPYANLNASTLRRLTISTSDDDEVAGLTSFAAAAAIAEKRTSSVLERLTIGVPTSTRLSFDDVAMFLKAWPSIRHIVVDRSDAKLPSRVAIAKLGRAEKTKKDAIVKIPLETLSLAPIGDCRDWLDRVSGSAAKSIKSLKVGFVCGRRDAGDFEQTFSDKVARRFENVSDLAIERFSPALPRDAFSKMLVSIARAFPGLKTLSVTDVYPSFSSASSSSASGGSDGSGWSPARVTGDPKFAALERLTYVMHNEFGDAALLTTKDLCETAIVVCPTLTTLRFEVVGPSALVADARTVGPVPLPSDFDPDAKPSPLEALTTVSIHVNDQVAAALLGLEFVEIARNLRDVDLLYDQDYVAPGASTALGVLKDNKHKFRALSSLRKDRPLALNVHSFKTGGFECDDVASAELSIESTRLLTTVYV